MSYLQRKKRQQKTRCLRQVKTFSVFKSSKPRMTAILKGTLSLSFYQGMLNRLVKLGVTQLIFVSANQENFQLGNGESLFLTCKSVSSLNLAIKEATGELLIFADGDHPVLLKQLGCYLRMAQQGKDIVLTRLAMRRTKFSQLSDLARLSLFLNVSLNRHDLNYYSFYAFPFLIRHSIVSLLGEEAFAFPASTLTKAILQNVCLAAAPYSVSKNFVQTLSSPIRRDFSKAWQIAQDHLGKRLYFPDPIRNRQLIQHEDEKDG